jgi:ABC-type nitrate/sulfonate/bicarbonate transport system permease component
VRVRVDLACGFYLRRALDADRDVQSAVSIALVPLALMWFGLGTGSLVFVLVHAVL